MRKVRKSLVILLPFGTITMVPVGNGFQQVNRGEGQDGSQDVVVLGQASMEKSILRLCSPQVVFRSESSKLVLRFRSLSRTLRKNFPLMMNSSPPHSPSILSSRSLTGGKLLVAALRQRLGENPSPVRLRWSLADFSWRRKMNQCHLANLCSHFKPFN